MKQYTTSISSYICSKKSHQINISELKSDILMKLKYLTIHEER